MFKYILSFLKGDFLLYLAFSILCVAVFFILSIAVVLSVFFTLMLVFPFPVSSILTLSFFALCVGLALSWRKYDMEEAKEQQEECDDDV